MPDAKTILENVLNKIGTKKAKVKTIKIEPAGTKAKKLNGKMAKAFREEFGSNFSQVKIHTGGNIREITKSIGVKAFTYGKDIYFGKNSEANNLELIAHELTHVVQRQGGKVKNATKGKVLTSK